MSHTSQSSFPLGGCLTGNGTGRHPSRGSGSHFLCQPLYQAVPAYGSAQTTVRKTAFDILWEMGLPFPCCGPRELPLHLPDPSVAGWMHKKKSQIKRCWECLAKVSQVLRSEGEKSWRRKKERKIKDVLNRTEDF